MYRKERTKKGGRPGTRKGRGDIKEDWIGILSENTRPRYHNCIRGTFLSCHSHYTSLYVYARAKMHTGESTSAQRSLRRVSRFQCRTFIYLWLSRTDGTLKRTRRHDIILRASLRNEITKEGIFIRPEFSTLFEFHFKLLETFHYCKNYRNQMILT